MGKKKNKQKDKAGLQNKSYFRWDVIIAILILVYIGLTTVIFVVNKKIDSYEHNEVSVNSSKSENTVTTASTALNTANFSAEFSEKETQLKEEANKNLNDKQKQQELAQFYHEHGKHSNAIVGYEKMLETNPNDVETHLSLAQLYMGLPGATDKATNHLNKVLEFQPEHPKKTIIEIWLQQLQERKK